MNNIFSHLNSFKIPFVVIGGHAVNYHGFIRATEDFDIIFHRTEQSEAQLFNALKSINACWLSNKIDPLTNMEKEIPVTFDYVKSNHLMMLCTSMGYLDIFDFIPDFQDIPVTQLLETSNDFNGIKIINLDWLKKLKQASGRPKDLNDLNSLP
ncbi:MAG: hypothetical protein JXR91_03815 [Deltaproteobacteria bacterium]|nr:hypothetical protein [Deltaproteobacteria bacterium]